MKEKLEILMFGLFGLWVIPIPMIMIIKYFKMVRHKRYFGVSDLFALLTPEWWIAGLTLGFPILGKDEESELNRIRKKANWRLIGFYGIIALQILIAGLLNII